VAFQQANEVQKDECQGIRSVVDDSPEGLWSPPPTDYVKINWDAAVEAKQGRIGLEKFKMFKHLSFQKKSRISHKLSESLRPWDHRYYYIPITIKMEFNSEWDASTLQTRIPVITTLLATVFNKSVSFFQHYNLP
jgi:hypothetical protein